MKKTLLALLVALMVLMPSTLSLAEDATTSLITATESLPVPPLPLVDTPITLTVMYPRQTAHGNFEDMWFLKEVEAQTNIKLEIQAIESAGWTEKLNLSFASGDLPDILLSGVSFDDANKFGMAGMLLPLEDLLQEYSPNAMAIFDYIPDTLRTVTASDGHIYMMPAYDTTARDMIASFKSINLAWLEKSGLGIPTTLDEFYEALIALRDGDGNGNGEADEIPFSFVYDGDSFDVVLSAFGYVNARHDVIDNEYIYVPMQDNFREYLKFMAKLYAEGLLDPEVFTQTSEQFSAKCSSYLLGCGGDQMKDYLSDETQKHAYTLLGPLTSEFNETKMWPGRSQENTSGTFCITSACEDPIAAVKLLDYFYSEDVTFMTKCGPEKGQWDGEGGWTRNIAEDGAVSYTIEYDAEQYNGFWNFRLANGLMNMPFFYTDVHAALVLGADPDATLISQQVFTSGCYDARRLGFPSGVKFTEDEQDILAPFVLLDSYVDQMVAKFITGAIDIHDDAQWQEYLNNIEMMDVATLIETRQAAYDRWNQVG